MPLPQTSLSPLSPFHFRLLICQWGHLPLLMSCIYSHFRLLFLPHKTDSLHHSQLHSICTTHSSTHWKDFPLAVIQVCSLMHPPSIFSYTHIPRCSTWDFSPSASCVSNHPSPSGHRCKLREGHWATMEDGMGVWRPTHLCSQQVLAMKIGSGLGIVQGS